MELKHSRIDEVLLRILYIAAAGTVLMQMLAFDAVTSVLYYLLFPITGILWLLSITKKFLKTDVLVILILVIAVLCVGINCFLMNGEMDFSYMKKVIIFGLTVLFLQISNKSAIKKSEMRFICRLMDGVTVLFILMYFLQGINRNLIGDIVSSYLTFKFSNPNLVAMFLLCLFMLQMTMLFSKGEKNFKWLHLVLAGVVAFFIYETGSRNSQLVMVLFTVSFLWLLFSMKKQFRISKVTALVVVVFPMVFYGAYMLFVGSSAVQRMFGFMISEGKALDSRMKVWGPAWEAFCESPIVGAYYQISDGTGISQMHNSHIDIAASYGAIVFFLVCLFLVVILYQNNRVYRKKIQLSYMLGFCGTIFMGMGEAALFSGGLSLFVFAGTFLLLANGQVADPYEDKCESEKVAEVIQEMRIVFLSNFYNHHQHFLAQEMNKCVKSFSFVETSDIPEERVRMGWSNENAPEYVYNWNRDTQVVKELLNQADVVLVGSAPEKLLKYCIKNKKLVVRYSERPLKNGIELKKYLPRLLKWHLQYPVWASVYLLCASGYTARDYEKYGLFINRSYRWGYFPETRKYDNVQFLMDRKDTAEILWCGRFLDWKHPDDVVVVAEKLKRDGYHFKISFIGSGEMEEQLRQMVKEAELEDFIVFLGTMKPKLVRNHMEQSGIFLFTSDRKEGWGAVLNEAMNSGCAVIASSEAGATPYLIKNGQNGLVYEKGNVDTLYEKVKYLLDNHNVQKEMGVAAYKSILETWNAEVAAERFINLVGHILAGVRAPELYLEGPCSKEELQIRTGS